MRSAALLGLSETHRKQGKFDEALTYEEKDYKISKALKNAMFIAQSLIEIGLIYCGKKEYKKQKTHFAKPSSLQKRERTSSKRQGHGCFLRAHCLRGKSALNGR